MVHTVDSIFRPKGKRPKPAEVGGLKPNWKTLAGVPKKPKHVPVVSQRESSPEVQDLDAELDFEGEFAVDEKADILAAVRASKSDALRGIAGGPKGESSSRAGGTAKVCVFDIHGYVLTVCHQMGVVFAKVKSEPADGLLQSNRPNARKPRYVNAHLPLENHAQGLKVWQNQVLPSVIDWAGSLNDSFNTTADPCFQPIIDTHWRRSFPDIDPTEAVHGMVSLFLTR